MAAFSQRFIGIVQIFFSAVILSTTFTSVFFEVKPSQKIQLSRRDMIFLILSVALLCIGYKNLPAASGINGDPLGGQDGRAPMEDSQGADGQNEQEAGGTGHSVFPEEDLSPEELLVKQNWDEIQQLKAQYSKADTETFSNESDSLGISIYETAGYVFQDLIETVKCDTLRGMEVPNVTLVIMDYSTDQIVRAFNSEEGYGIRYSPGNENEFYAVAFHEDYEIYVTHPFKVTHGDGSTGTYIYLEKKGSKYTPVSRLRLLLNTGQEYSVAPPQYYAVFFMNKDGNSIGRCYGSITESGILSWLNGTYFSLNTDYTMELCLKETTDSDSIESTHETFNGSDANSNLTHLYFDFNQEDSDT